LAIHHIPHGLFDFIEFAISVVDIEFFGSQWKVTVRRLVLVVAVTNTVALLETGGTMPFSRASSSSLNVSSVSIDLACSSSLLVNIVGELMQAKRRGSRIVWGEQVGSGARSGWALALGPSEIIIYDDEETYTK
jgi:hypothetical protein